MTTYQAIAKVVSKGLERTNVVVLAEQAGVSPNSVARMAGKYETLGPGRMRLDVVQAVLKVCGMELVVRRRSSPRNSSLR